jgi:hypothetical protein
LPTNLPIPLPTITISKTFPIVRWNSQNGIQFRPIHPITLNIGASPIPSNPPLFHGTLIPRLTVKTFPALFFFF